MMQDPQGQPQQGPAPIVPPISAPRLPQEPQPFQVPAVPALPPVMPPVLGSDAPPALSTITRGGMPPPPSVEGFELPPVLPTDPAVAEQLLLRLQQQINAQTAHDSYAIDADTQRRVEEAPARAADIQRRMRFEPYPDGVDYDAEIKDVEPYLPPSKAKQLKDSRRRLQEGPAHIASFEKELEQSLRKSNWDDLHTDESREYEALGKELEKLLPGPKPWKQDGDAWVQEQGESPVARISRAFRGDANDKRVAEIAARMSELEAKGVSVERPAKLRDIGRGLGSLVTDKQGVQDDLLDKAAEVRERFISNLAPDHRYDWLDPEKVRSGEILREPAPANLPPGWTKDTARAVFTEASQRVIARLKRPSDGADLVGQMAGALPWMAAGAGEVKIAGEGVKAAAKVIPWLARGTKAAKLVSGTAKYIAGPALMEGTYAAVRPLQPTQQAEVDAIEDPKARESREGAYRLLNGTRDAALSALFNVGVLRELGRSVPKEIVESQARKYMAGIATGLVMPAAAEATTETIAAGAKLFDDNEGEVADVLADMQMSGELAGPIRGIVRAHQTGEGVAQAYLEYGKAVLPGMAGIGAAHAITAMGSRLSRRADLMTIRNAVEKDIAALPQEEQQAAREAFAPLLREAEELAPSHSEDERLRNQDTIDEHVGPQAEQHVVAEKAAEELLPDIPGKSLDEKISVLRREVEAMPDDPVAGKWLDVAEQLDIARQSETRADAELRVEMARRAMMDEGNDDPVDAADGEATWRGVGDAVEDRMVQRQLELHEKPTAEDGVLRRVADDLSAEWRVISRDDDAGASVLSKVDEPTRTITVADDDLPRYRLQQDGASNAPVHASERQEAAPATPVVDELYSKAVEAVKGGAVSSRDIAKTLGVTKYRGDKLRKQLIANGVLTPKGAKAEPAPEAKPADPETLPTELEVADDSLHELEDAIGKDIGTIADELENGGESETLQSRARAMQVNLMDAAAIRNPKNPKAAAVQMVARWIDALPKGSANDDRLMQMSGLSRAEVATARELAEGMRFTPEMQEQVSVSMRSIVDVGRSRMTTEEALAQVSTDPIRAMREPVTTALPNRVARVFAEAKRAGSEKKAAEAAYQAWRDGRDSGAPTYEAWAKDNMRAVDSLRGDILDPESHLQGISDLAEYMSQLSDADEHVGMLSLAESGRRVLLEAHELFHDVRFKGEVSAKRRRGESGMVDARLLGAGVVVDLAHAAIAGAKYLADTPGKALRAAVRLAHRAWAAKDSARDWSLKTAFEAIGKPHWFRSKDQIRALRAERRAQAARNRLAGKHWTELKSFLWDRLSLWGEEDMILQVERASQLTRIAMQGENLLHKHFKEDSDADYSIKEWLRLAGVQGRDESQEARFKLLDAKWTPKQREVLEGVQHMMVELRDLAARDYLPTQVVRKRHLGLLSKVGEAQGAEVQKAATEFNDLVAERDALRKTLKAAGIREVNKAPAYKKLRSKTESARQKMKRLQDRMQTTLERIAKLQNEAAAERKKWGVTDEGFAPDVMDRDPSESYQQALRKGLIDFDEVMRSMADQKTASEAMDRDAATRPLTMHMKPSLVRAGHWMRSNAMLRAAEGRKAEIADLRRQGLTDEQITQKLGVPVESIEQAVAADRSFTRSFFHYTREVFRVMAASQWYEKNHERLFGASRVVSADELASGSLNGGGKDVELISDMDSPTSRGAGTNYRLGGSAFELKLEGKDGKKKSIWLWNKGDFARAKQLVEGSPAELHLSPDDQWKVAEEQEYARKIVLLPASGAEVQPGSKARVGEGPMGPEEGGSQPTRPFLPGKDAMLLWESEAAGRIFARGKGKIDAIMEASGRNAAEDFASYVREGIASMTSGIPLDMAQRSANLVTSWVRHFFLGGFNVFSAIKEFYDTTTANMQWMGVGQTLEAAGVASEFALRLRRGYQEFEKSPGAFFRESVPKLNADKNLVVAHPTLLKHMKLSDRDKAKLGAEAAIREELFEDMMMSAHAADSADDFLTDFAVRQFEYGQPMHFSTQSPTGPKNAFEIARDATHVSARWLSKKAWAVRHMAQQHGRRQTWAAAYLAARRGGKERAEARATADLYSLANGNLGNRMSQSKVWQSTAARLIRPLAGYNAAISSANWRFFFHGGVGEAGMARSVAKFAGTAAKRVLAWGAMAFMLQQGANLFGVDLARSMGTSASEVPAVGKMALWSTRKLQHYLNLAADPADPSGELPAYRSKAAAWARQHAPQFLAEWIARQAETAGTWPGDVPLPTLWGTWTPMAWTKSQKWWEWAQASWTGDQKKADDLYYRQGIGGFWALRARDAIVGGEVDPSDPNYVRVVNPATGVTMNRLPRGAGETMRAILNMSLPDAERSAEIIRNSVIEPMRTDLQAAQQRGAGYRQQRMMMDAKRLREKAAAETNPEARARLETMAKQREADFKQAIIEHAKAEELTRGEARSRYIRMKKAAEANVQLTTAERDILNAYDSDTAFQLLANQLDKAGPDRLSQDRFNTIAKLWYADSTEMQAALRRSDVKTRERFMRSYRSAKVRWQLEAQEQK